MTQKNKILIMVVIGIFLISLLDLTKADYVFKAILKIILFLSIPIFYYRIDKNIHWRDIFIIKGESLKYSLMTGIVLYIIILLFYFGFGSFFDFSTITRILRKTIGANYLIFLVVSVYISLINSFIEELFFRGFAFINLKKYTSRRFALVFSSIAFAFYHITLIKGLFPLPLYLLSLSAIAVAGLLFNLFDDQTNSIYPSWIIHGFANLAINTIGVILLWL